MTFPKHESITFDYRINEVSARVGYPINVVRNVLREDYKLRRSLGFPKELNPFAKQSSAARIKQKERYTCKP